MSSVTLVSALLFFGSRLSTYVVIFLVSLFNLIVLIFRFLSFEKLIALRSLVEIFGGNLLSKCRLPNYLVLRFWRIPNFVESLSPGMLTSFRLESAPFS